LKLNRPHAHEDSLSTATVHPLGAPSQLLVTSLDLDQQLRKPQGICAQADQTVGRVRNNEKVASDSERAGVTFVASENLTGMTLAFVPSD
jgi:hypothetical protein